MPRGPAAVGIVTKCADVKIQTMLLSMQNPASNGRATARNGTRPALPLQLALTQSPQTLVLPKDEATALMREGAK